MRRRSMVGLLMVVPLVLAGAAAANLGPFADDTAPVAGSGPAGGGRPDREAGGASGPGGGDVGPAGAERAALTDRPGGATAAGGGDVETRKVLERRLTSDGRAYRVLQLSGQRLRGGEPRLMYGSLSATSRFGMLQQIWLNCSTGTPHKSDPDRSVLSSRNHEGAENGVPGQRSISVLWLFTPRASGVYNCALWANGGHIDRSPKKWLEVIEGAGTVLRMQGTPETGAIEWRQATDVHLRRDNPKTEAREDISHAILRKRWTARPGARSIDVFAGPQASSDSGGHDPFVLDTTVVVSQLDAKGNQCAPNTTTRRRTAIPGLLHHLKINIRRDNIPIRTTRGCTRTFDIKVVGQYVLTRPSETANRPGLIHGKIPIPPDRFYSSAIAMNN
jgi:hypothetical protein